MKLTGRGRKTVLSILLLGLFSLIFLDWFIFIPMAAVIGILSYGYFEARNAKEDLSQSVEIDPPEIGEEMTAGESYRREIYIKNNSDHSIMLSCEMDYANVFPDVWLEGDSEGERDYSFYPDLSREYESDELLGEIKGKFGMWTGEESVSLKQSFRVRARVLAAAIRAAKFLEAAGRSGFGDQPTDIKGTGLEYAGSREYQPGDEIRHMDWKATARLNRPIIKEYYLEGGLGVHLVHEVGAPDPVSQDELSTSFLNTALALAQRTIPFGLTVFEGETTHLHVNRVEPRIGLALAMQHSLEGAEREVEDVYRVLEPRTSREVRDIMNAVDSETVKRALGSGISESGTDRGPYRTLEETLKNSGGRLHLVFNSSLSGEIRCLLELEDFARMKNCELMVLQPTTPWKQGDDLEERYEIRERYGRLHGILRNRGIPLSGSVEGLIEQISSERLALERGI